MPTLTPSTTMDGKRSDTLFGTSGTTRRSRKTGRPAAAGAGMAAPVCTAVCGAKEDAGAPELADEPSRGALTSGAACARVWEPPSKPRSSSSSPAAVHAATEAAAPTVRVP